MRTPDLVGKSVKEAEKITKELGLNVLFENATEEFDKENTIIMEQTPKPGIMINRGTNVYVK